MKTAEFQKAVCEAKARRYAGITGMPIRVDNRPSYTPMVNETQTEKVNTPKSYTTWLHNAYITMAFLLGLLACPSGRPNFRGMKIPSSLRYNDGQPLYRNPPSTPQSYYAWRDEQLRCMTSEIMADFRAMYPSIHTLEIQALMLFETERLDLYRKPVDSKTVKRSCISFELSQRHHIDRGKVYHHGLLRNKRFTKHHKPLEQTTYFGGVGRNPYDPILSADNYRLYEATYSHEAFRTWALRSMRIELAIGKADLSKSWFNRDTRKACGNVDRDLPVFNGKVLSKQDFDKWAAFLGSRLVDRGIDFIDVPLYSRKSAELRVKSRRFDLYESQRRGKETAWFASTLWLYQLPKRFVHGDKTITGLHYGFHLGNKRQAARSFDKPLERIAVENTITAKIAARVLANRKAKLI